MSSTRTRFWRAAPPRSSGLHRLSARNAAQESQALQEIFRESADQNEERSVPGRTERKVCERAAGASGLPRMLRSRLTWIILAALVVLIAVAVLDALRSPDKATSASATTAATTPLVNYVMNQAPGEVVGPTGEPRADCTSSEQLSVLVTIIYGGNRWEGQLLVQPIACRQAHPYFRIALRDRRGKRLGVWSGRLRYNPGYSTNYANFWPVPCSDPPTPLLVLVTVGDNPAPSGQPVRAKAECVSH
jgi:hypothetical protein